MNIKQHYQDTISTFKDVDFSKPHVILICISGVILPFVAKYYVLIGLLLGLLLSVMTLFLVDKSPRFVKRFIISQPLMADLMLSSAAVGLVGVYFGDGLSLGLGAVFCALILSWAINRYKKQPDKFIYGTTG